MTELLRRAPPQYGQYIEPFAGSACLFFAARPNKAVLGDINPEVIHVYEAIQSFPLEVAEALESIPRTPEAYYALRAVLPTHLTLPQRAARLIFLMKSCFNGVYRTNSRGEFNVPMGDRTYALPTLEQLLAAQALLKNTKLIDGDFSHAIKKSRPGDWVYLDPPYKPTSRYRGEFGYSARFSDDSFSRLIESAKVLAATGRYVMLSYTADLAVKEALSDWSIHEVSPMRTVSANKSQRQVVSELIATSYPT